LRRPAALAKHDRESDDSQHSEASPVTADRQSVPSAFEDAVTETLRVAGAGVFL
jgi:hypothetical protein